MPFSLKSINGGILNSLLINYFYKINLQFLIINSIGPSMISRNNNYLTQYTHPMNSRLSPFRQRIGSNISPRKNQNRSRSPGNLSPIRKHGNQQAYKTKYTRPITGFHKRNVEQQWSTTENMEDYMYYSKPVIDKSQMIYSKGYGQTQGCIPYNRPIVGNPSSDRLIKPDVNLFSKMVSKFASNKKPQFQQYGQGPSIFSQARGEQRKYESSQVGKNAGNSSFSELIKNIKTIESLQDKNDAQQLGSIIDSKPINKASKCDVGIIINNSFSRPSLLPFDSFSQSAINQPSELERRSQFQPMELPGENILSEIQEPVRGAEDSVKVDEEEMSDYFDVNTLLSKLQQTQEWQVQGGVEDSVKMSVQKCVLMSLTMDPHL